MTDKDAVHQKLKQLSKIAHGEAHIIVLLCGYVEAEPQDMKATLAYADALRIVGRQRDAVRLFKRAFKSATNSTDKAYVAIRIAMSLENTNPAEAEEWYATAMDLDDALPGWAWGLRGANLTHLERFEAAIDCNARALKSKDVDRDEVLKNIALAYRAMADYDTCAAYLQRAIAATRGDKELKQMRAGLQGLEQTRAFARTLIKKP